MLSKKRTNGHFYYKSLSDTGYPKQGSFEANRSLRRKRVCHAWSAMPQFAMSNRHGSCLTRLTNHCASNAVTATVRAIPRRSLRARSTASHHRIAVAIHGPGGATGANHAQTLADMVPKTYRYVVRTISAAGSGEATATSGVGDGDDVATGHKKKLRVAYQGMPGAYSEAAALTAYPTCDPCPCDQFENAFEATEQWTADRAVLPFENSLGGSIHRNYDLILQHRLHIVGEVSALWFCALLRNVADRMHIPSSRFISKCGTASSRCRDSPRKKSSARSRTPKHFPNAMATSPPWVW